MAKSIIIFNDKYFTECDDDTGIRSDHLLSKIRSGELGPKCKFIQIYTSIFHDKIYVSSGNCELVRITGTHKYDIQPIFTETRVLARNINWRVLKKRYLCLLD